MPKQIQDTTIKTIKTTVPSTNSKTYLTENESFFKIACKT